MLNISLFCCLMFSSKKYLSINIKVIPLQSEIQHDYKVYKSQNQWTG